MPRSTSSLILLALVCVIGPAASAQYERKPLPKDVGSHEAGDLRRVRWILPFKKAQEEARRTNRILLVKPILGGSYTPNPKGIPCGGPDDCEGAW